MGDLQLPLPFTTTVEQSWIQCVDILLWLLPYYFLTVALEAPFVIFGLPNSYPLKVRIFSAFWLTACTYPIVNVVTRELLVPNFGLVVWMAVAETFAPVAEFFIFWFTFARERSPLKCKREFVAILLANLFSFGVGLALTVLNVRL